MLVSSPFGCRTVGPVDHTVMDSLNIKNENLSNKDIKINTYTKYTLYTHVAHCEQYLLNITSNKNKIYNLPIQTETTSNFTSSLSDHCGIDFSTLKLFKEKCGNDFFFLEAFLEDTIYFLRKLYIAFTSDSVISNATEAILLYMRLRSKMSLFELSLVAAGKVDNVLSDIYLDFIESIVASTKKGKGLEVQALDEVSDGVNNAYDILNKFTSLKDTLVYQKLNRLLTYFVAYGLCDRIGLKMSTLGYRAMEANMLKIKLHNGPSFIITLMDTILYVLKKGIQVIKTGDINCIYHSGDTYGQLFDNYCKLKTQNGQLHNPELFGFDISSYQNLLDDTIEAFSNAKKHSAGSSKYDKESIGKCLNDLQLWRTDLITKKSSRNMRKAPFSVLLFGESGVGKTYLKEILFHYYGNIMKLDTKSDYCFTRSPGANFWDGFRSSMWCVVLDDVGFPHPNKCPNGDETYKDMIQIQNNQPFCPDQAALEDKGRTPMMAKLLIATTNIKTLNASQYFTHASAAQRRLPIVITPTVKPEFAKEDGMLDRSKLPNSDSNAYDDYWLFKVEVVQANLTTSNKKNADYILVLENASLKDLLLYLAKAIKDHDDGQNKFLAAVNDMQTIDICDLCKLPAKQFCTCDPEKVAMYQKVLKDRERKQIEESTGTNYLNNTIKVFNKLCDKFKPKLTSDDKALKQHLYDTFDVDNENQDLNNMQIQGTIEIHVTCIFYLTIICTIIYKVMSFRLDEIKENVQVLRRVTYYPKKYYKFFDKIKTKVIGYNNNTREYWVQLGNRQQRRLIGNTTMIGLASIISVCTVVFTTIKIYNKFNKVADNQIQNDGYTPKPRNNEKSNPWVVTGKYNLSTFDLKPPSLSTNSTELTEFASRISVNCAVIETSVPNKLNTFRSGRAVCLQGNMYLTNNHNIPPIDDQTQIKFIFQSEILGVNENISFKLTESQIVRLPSTDLCIIYVRAMPPRGGIYKYLPNRSYESRNDGLYAIKQKDGSIKYNNVPQMTHVGNASLPKLNAVCNIWRCYVKEPTLQGECGSILISNSKLGKSVCGMHVMGENSTSVCISLYSEMFDSYINSGWNFAVQCGTPKLSSKEIVRNIGDVHYKSPFRYIEDGSANVYGSYIGFRGKPKSRVVATPMSRFLTNHDYKIKFGKPEMSSYEPWRIALLDMVKPVTQWDNDIVEKVTNNFIDDIFQGLNDDDYKTIHVYDHITTINGAAGVTYVDKINRNTSAGAPWKKSKQHYMIRIAPVGDLQDPVDITDEIKERIDTIIHDYKLGQRACPIFTAHLKDEAVSFKKVKMKKTRVFCGAPLDFTYVVRKYLLSCVRLIQTKRELFESAPGTIAQSLEWEQLYRYITKYGTNKIIAGDYAKFDKRMAPVLVANAFKILRAICQKSGNYTDEDLKVIDCISVDIMYPYVDYNGDLTTLYGTNPSGHPLTVIINGLVNCIMMRYQYYLLNPDREAKTFKDNVALMTYGDDNICSVSDNANWFNHTAIASGFNDIGVGYTMADKEAKSIPFIDIKDASFLKRTWRFDDNIGYHLAPLEHDSIEKMLMVWVDSKSICEKEQAIAVISSAIREYFFYGEDIFEIKRQLFLDLIDNLDLQLWQDDFTLPTWNELERDFWDNSQDVNL